MVLRSKKNSNVVQQTIKTTRGVSLALFEMISFLPFLFICYLFCKIFKQIQKHLPPYEGTNPRPSCVVCMFHLNSSVSFGSYCRSHKASVCICPSSNCCSISCIHNPLYSHSGIRQAMEITTKIK